MFNQNNRSRNSTSLIIRMIAGGYLIYLVYQMIKDGALTANTGWKLVAMVAAMAAFVGFGLFFIIKGIQGLRKIREEENTEPAEETEELPASEETEEAEEDGEIEAENDMAEDNSADDIDTK